MGRWRRCATSRLSRRGDVRRPCARSLPGPRSVLHRGCGPSCPLPGARADRASAEVFIASGVQELLSRSRLWRSSFWRSTERAASPKTPRPMQAEFAARPRWHRGSAEPRIVVLRLTARRAVRPACSGVCVRAYVATHALAYASSYRTVAQRAGLAKEFGSNAGVSALVGPRPRHPDGCRFTVWKCLAVLPCRSGLGGCSPRPGCCAARRTPGAGAAAGRPDHAQGRRRPGARRLACGVAVLWTSAPSSRSSSGVRRRSTSVPRERWFWPLRSCGGGRDVPGCRGPCEPARRDAPSGIRLRRRRPRRELRAPHGRRLGYRTRWLRWTSPLGWVEDSSH